MIGHFSADDLAGYRAGTVSDSRAARIGSHLATCTRCANVDSGLSEVSALLASMPVPAMPEQVTQRLQATIAQEAARRGAGVSLSAASPASIPGRPDLPERTRKGRVRRPRARVWSSPLVLRGLAAASVLVILVAGGIFFVNRGTVRSESTAGSAAPKPVAKKPSTAIVGSGAPTPVRYRHGGRYVYTSAVTSSANYTKASLPDGVRNEVRSSATVTGPSTGAVPSSTVPSTAVPVSNHQLDRVNVSRLESCLATVAAGKLVQLVEVARYQGQSATIIVLKPVNGVFDVIVVGQACGSSSQDVITRLTVSKR